MVTWWGCAFICGSLQSVTIPSICLRHPALWRSRRALLTLAVTTRQSVLFPMKPNYQGALGSYPLHTFGKREELIALWSDKHKPYVWPWFYRCMFSLTSWFYKHAFGSINKQECLQISVTLWLIHISLTGFPLKNKSYGVTIYVILRFSGFSQVLVRGIQADLSFSSGWETISVCLVKLKTTLGWFKMVFSEGLPE